MNANARRKLVASTENRALLESLLSANGNRPDAQSPIRPRTTYSPAPASYAQERLWFLDQFQPGGSIYTIPAAIRLPGPLSVSLLERCVNEIVRRHESLRTTFASVEGRPVQIVAPELRVRLQYVDLERSFAGSERETEAQRLAAVESRRPFDLARGPLLRVMLLRPGAADHILLLNVHHIISDGWSMGVLLRELSTLYEAYSSGRPSPLPELAIQYADFAQWQREWLSGAVLEEHLQWWREQLQGAPGELELPTDRARPVMPSFQGATELFLFTPALSEALKQLSQREGVTLFMVLLAGFEVLLARYTGESDIVIGTPIANRTRTEVEPLIGFFVNTLVLRGKLSGNPSFRELLARVRETTLGAYAHQDVPFEKLVQELQPERALNRNPLFQVMLVLQNAPGNRMGAAAAPSAGTWPVGTGTAKFDLTLFVMEGGEQLSGAVEYSTDLFDAARMRRLVAQYQTLLEAAAANPARGIWDLPLLSEPERRQLLEWSRGAAAPEPASATLHERFEEQAERRPQAVALVFEGGEWSYAELNARANRLAHYLRRQGIGPEQLAGICLDRSPEMIVAVLAIAKTGAAYLPVDPEYPRERREFLLRDSRCAILLTCARLAPCFAGIEFPLLCLDEAHDRLAGESDENIRLGLNADSGFYNIYTSGSTGRPKGAVVGRANFANLLAWFINEFEMSENDGVLLVSSFSFDLTQKNIFAPLATGARLCLAPAGHFDIDVVCDTIRNQRITLLNCTPSAFYSLIDEQNRPYRKKLQTLRLVFLGGEPISAQRLRPWITSPDCQAQVVNTYGPTECADIGAYYRLTQADYQSDAPVPIGYAIPNVRLAVVDQWLRLLPVGVPGELCIAGAGVGRGYLGNPALMAERFVPSILARESGDRMYRTGDLVRYRADGALEFLGRMDQQVKIRGYRIELTEIESVLQAHAGVARAAVATVERAGDAALTAYVVPDEKTAAAVRELARLQQAGVDDGRQHAELPNGAFVFHMNARETEFLYREIFEERTYLRNGVAIEDGAVIFDVGANIGLFSLFASQAASDVKVYAFEPIPPVFETLQLNGRVHALNVQPFACGLSSGEGSAAFTYYPHASILSGRFSRVDDVRETVRIYLENESAHSLTRQEMAEVLDNRLQSETFVCPLKTISQVIRENGVERIDLLKVDVERCEWEVLAGIDPDDWARIHHVVLEIHDLDGQLSRITNKLRSEGFEVAVEAEPRLRDTDLYNVWAVRPERVRPAAASHTRHSSTRSWRGPGALTADIRHHLSEQLPAYMVPNEFVFLDSLPVSPNGKLDRRALANIESRSTNKRSEHVEPRNEIETLLAGIWREVLAVNRVSIFDDFFELGGHSLLATQAMSRLRAALDVDLPLRVLFESKTIANVAAVVAEMLSGSGREPGDRVTRRSGAPSTVQVDSLSDEEVSAMLAEILHAREAAE